MKHFIKYMFLVCFLVATQSCDELLNGPSPSTQISFEDALNNPGAVSQMRARMYSRFHVGPDMNTTWLLGPDALADNTFIRPGRDRFEGLNLNEIGSGIGTAAWNNLYDTINDANILISGIPEGVISDALATQYAAEAKFIRALCLHHLARIFGYEPGVTPASGEGQNFTTGVIIRTEPVLSLSAAEFKSRSSVADVYTQIVSDLTDAIADLGNSGEPFFASQAAAQALMARVRLYQGQYDLADAMATAALSGTSATLATQAQVPTMFDETVSTNPEAIFAIDVNASTETAGANNSLSAYTGEQWLAQIPTQDLIDLYEAGDPRLSAWYTPCLNDVTGSNPGGCDNVNINGLEFHKYAAEQGTFADDYVHIRVSEMILIQAEARLNETGVAPAIERLNFLRAERSGNAYAGPITPADILNEILDERRRELVGEGHRFFDLKRLGRDIRKVSFDNATDVTTVSSIPFNDFRVLDDIPDSEVALNDLLIQNPGYN